jgi:hypothetical protein
MKSPTSPALYFRTTVATLGRGAVDGRRRRRNAGALLQGLGEAEYELAFFTEDARTY